MKTDKRSRQQMDIGLVIIVFGKWIVPMQMKSRQAAFKASMVSWLGTSV